MVPRCPGPSGPFLSFLYPTLFRSPAGFLARASFTTFHPSSSSNTAPTGAGHESTSTSSSSAELPRTRLNPAPDDYAISTFADKARITIHAGGGGHGCISFLREAFLANGPANGGDGGHGGNVYIQAVHGETSLHKLSRRRFIRASRGKTGQGSSQGGARGEDVIINVPVGTVVREIERMDPMLEESTMYRAAREKEKEHNQIVKEAEARAKELGNVDEDGNPIVTDLPEAPEPPNMHKFILYPGISTSERRNLELPRLPRRDRVYVQPPGPIHLDLSTPTPRPILLATGGIGGLGNPHFVSKDRPRPLFATKGERAVSMQLELELKLLADVGFVGLPNAGKSTLLRALTRSRARVGNWAFTTLQPNIGTVVLDNNRGRAFPSPKRAKPAAPHAVVQDATYGSVVISQPGMFEGAATPEPRTRFTVADIPGLIEGAHLDRGLGIEFLRHVERAGVLAFVVDLSAGDAVEALKALWKEVGSYARMREQEEEEREVDERVDWEGDGTRHNFAGGLMYGDMPEPPAPSDAGLHIAGKPWFVIATKGDLPNTEDNYARLKGYLERVTGGEEEHPSGVEDGWTEDCTAIPVSAINGHGVDRIIHWTLGLLDE